MKMLIPSTMELTVKNRPGWEMVVYQPDVPVPEEHRDAEALVIWGARDPDVVALAQELPRVRWVQALSAGTDAITNAGFPPATVITSGRGLHDATVAEHALSLILAAVRSLPGALRAQNEHRWAAELGGMQSETKDEPLKTVSGTHIVIWGFGSIGSTLAKHLDALGAGVSGIATNAGTRHGFEITATSDAPELLSKADILVMILPSTESTRHALDQDLIRLLPRRAWVVNVGRGSTINEAALAAALSEGTIAGAALDVFEQEPLGSDSPLWDLDNVIITPHAAGGRPRGAGQLIEENLSALEEGRTLRNVVGRKLPGQTG
ncbi:NAD(P)-dependent oxidoreductase [Arthrobacter castelli]|uniref:NAD(P)-dependent oxidoreductase n=1 Tax=Arthrobacter castelli TaxID=271431 RepID=UPI00040327E0|nr:NAD(P)-dependent oxidoreductase [Arthrobacter castelli]